jgi:hypothetical protein
MNAFRFPFFLRRANRNPIPSWILITFSTSCKRPFAAVVGAALTLNWTRAILSTEASSPNLLPRVAPADGGPVHTRTLSGMH